MTIYQLECFIAVAEELNFSAAAERLFTTQPAITYQINALEKETGLHLFEHTTRRTKLTAAAAEMPATEPEESMDIVREKHFALKPCSTEEAILQMDLLGHSFFLYHSTENDKIQVVYRRADGGYGVLIPEA